MVCQPLSPLRASSERGGFTLVEVLMVMAVLAIGILAVTVGDVTYFLIGGWIQNVKNRIVFSVGPFSVDIFLSN